MANNIFKKKEITLDTFNDLNKEMIASFSQGDRISDKLLIRLTNDTGPLDLTDVVQVRIDFRKPDGKLVFQYCNIEDRSNGLISAILTTQTLAAPGKVYAEVTAKYPEGKDAVTRQFTFWVQDAIASDKSIESQNEWPMLERAIVAGDMLAGVDLVAIIKAGELAAAALPKTGGTMTGNRVMDRKLATNSIYDQFVTGSTSNYFVGVSAAGKYHLYDDIAKITPFEYDPVAKSFNVLSATNVVKKAGDTMTGNLNFAAASQIQNLAATGQLVFGNSGMWINDTNGNFVPWQYRYSDKQFIVNADTNLVKKAGDTMTGDLTFEPGKAIIFKSSGSTNNVYVLRGQAGQNKLVLSDSTTGKFILDYFSDTDIFSFVSALNLAKGATSTGTLLMSGTSAMIRVDDKGQSIRIDQPNDTTTTSARGLAIYENNALIGGMGRIRNGTSVDQMYLGWGSNPWSENTSLTVSDTKFLYKNKAVLTAEKDGQEDLVLTNAVNPDVNYKMSVTRRGNTVMLKGAVTVDANAASMSIATLSANYRPANGNVSVYLPSTDGTAMIQVFVNGTSGTLALTNNAKGKRIDIVLTYVAN